MAMWSQTTVPRLCSPIEREISRSLSQNCAACVLEIRASAAVEGDDQSVNSTGSHTTKIFTGFAAKSAIMRLNAEAPCRHTGQVGDRSNRTRGSSLAALNSLLISPRLRTVIFRNGG